MDESQPIDVLDLVKEILGKHPLCDHCLGRQFAWLSTRTSNLERGHSLKLVLSMIADASIRTSEKNNPHELLSNLAGNGMFEPAKSLCNKYAIEFETVDNCHLCFKEGISVYEKILGVVERTKDMLKSIEFDTFLVGSVPDPMLAEKQDEICSQFGLLNAETLKSDFNRELGKQLGMTLNKTVDFERPDIVIIYDFVNDIINLQINPIFIYGRYRKVMRGIPQSKWDCSDCKGKGCEKCDNTGRRYPDSVSEYIGIPSQAAAQGVKFKVHAAGREDVDALMLGSGRPFVVEISEPKIRRPNLELLQEFINKEAKGKVEVNGLEITDRKRGQDLKQESSSNVKEYTAIIKTEEDVDEDDLRKAETLLSGAELEQRTPNRVAHRRSDLVRKKAVYEVRLTKKESCMLEGFFKVQGGAYVKELISGDDGRTSPSVSSALGTSCVCVELNVTAIHSNPNA
ncbi:MAG: tRNA pseudouridine(54/55) synthase Pus10 [Candidatus Thorarchaeota archaeon]